MIRLNLPSFAIKLSGTQQHPRIFDILRHRYVALTPEEWVRQHFINFLIEHKGYPSELLANEVKLKIGNKSLRADSVLYDRTLKARMIIEYKAPSVNITQDVFEQIMRYNSTLCVRYLLVSNGKRHFCCRLDYEKLSYEFIDYIPAFPDL